MMLKLPYFVFFYSASK